MCQNAQSRYSCGHACFDNWEPCRDMFQVDGKNYYCDARVVFEQWTMVEKCFGCRYALKDRVPRVSSRALVKQVVEGEGTVVPRRKRSNAIRE